MHATSHFCRTPTLHIKRLLLLLPNLWRVKLPTSIGQLLTSPRNRARSSAGNSANCLRPPVPKLSPERLVGSIGMDLQGSTVSLDGVYD
jgi:hypothetical protein